MKTEYRKRQDDIDLHLEVLSVVLSRPEFKGYELDQGWIADYTGVSIQAVSRVSCKALAKLKGRVDRIWHEE